jgi:hypothetical protein
MKAYVYSANGVAIADVAKPTPKGTQVLGSVDTYRSHRTMAAIMTTAR